MHLTSWDVLVIGAGPAGCAAAIEARRAGLSVGIMEAAGQCRRVPGETLHPGVEPLFAQLGILEAVFAASFHRHRGIWTAWGSRPSFSAYGADEAGPWLGFQAKRQDLHHIMMRAAIDCGAKLHKPVTATGVLVEAGRVKGVLAHGREFRARWTADATGRRAWLATSLGLNVTHHSPAMRAHFGWTSHARPDLDSQPEIRATKEGWIWHAPLGGGEMAWVRLNIAVPRSDALRQGGVDMSWRIRDPCAGAGYFLLGDAARVLDPASSHGVLHALMSGILCGHLAAGYLKHGRSEEDVITEYNSWLRRGFDSDVARLRELYASHPSSQIAAQFQ